MKALQRIALIQPAKGAFMAGIKIKNVELVIRQDGKEKKIQQKVGTGIYEKWKVFMKEYYGDDFIKIEELDTENVSG